MLIMGLDILTKEVIIQIVQLQHPLPAHPTALAKPAALMVVLAHAERAQQEIPV